MKKSYNNHVRLGLAAEKWIHYPSVALNHVMNNHLMNGFKMTNQKQFYVYLHLRPTNDGVNSVFYVGKGNKRRCSLSFERNNYHTNIVKKYGKENIIIRKLPCE
jgi:hypothetical protein